MKLTDFKNEDAIELLADIMEPVAKILADEKVKTDFKSNAPKIIMAKNLLKNHKGEVLEILAILDGTNPEEYECNVFGIISKLLEILNDKELVAFFTQAGLTTDSEESFGNVSEITEASEK